MILPSALCPLLYKRFKTDSHWVQQIGIAYEYLDIPKSIATYNRAIEAYTTAGMSDYVNDDALGGMGNVYITLMYLHSKTGEVEKSLEYFRKAEAIIKDEHVQTSAYLYEVMAAVQETRKRYDLALIYEKKTLKAYIDANSKTGIQGGYLTTGKYFMLLHQPDSAYVYLKHALDISGSYTRDRDKSEILIYLADLSLGFNKQAEARNYMAQVEQLSQNLNNSFHLRLVYAGLADSYTQLEEYEKASGYGEKAYTLAKETGNISALENVLFVLQKAALKTGNYKKAALYLSELLVVKDSLQSEKNRKTLEELVQQYEVNEKQAQIELQSAQLSRQQTFLVASGLIAALLLTLVFLSYRIAQQRKKTNAQLRQLDTAKSRFFTNISHELRTPLTLILGPLENALNRTKNKTVSEDLELAKSNSKKLLNLVNEIMDLSKLESGKLELNSTTVHFHNLLRRIFFAYESLAKLSGIQLDFDYQLPDDFWVKLDINKFEKIVNNLLANALKFTDRGGRVQLAVGSLQLAGKTVGSWQSLVGSQLWIELEVRDTGKGIHRDDLPRVFDRFYQSGQKEESLQGGTGIGLALAKELTHLLKGELAVESKLGEGTAFYLKFPLELTEAKANYQRELIKTLECNQPENDIQIADYQPIILNKNKPKVLVVEDNPEMSRYLVQTLSVRYQCSTAMDGVEALDKLQTQKFDLVTSDVMMPNMDGFTFLKKVHQRELFSHTPVIMLTARSLEEDKLRGFQLGVDDYITKPFSSKELIARIDNLLKNKKEREEVQKKLASKQNENTETETISAEQELLKKAEALALINLDNSNYKVADLAKEMAYSERQLGRIIKKLTGFAPKQFIRELRLQKAWQLLEIRQFASIGEVSFEVGIDNTSYFSKVFLERFGKKPSEVNGGY